MKKYSIITILALFLLTAYTIAQKTNVSENIFETLATPDSISKAKIVVHQDERIEQLFLKNKNIKSTQTPTSINGYRVQVFSSNTQRTAKDEAFKIEKQIRELFPEEEVYVNYTSPFWKVRVGDFNTMEKALAFRTELIAAFPQVKSDTYIVREQILYSGSK